MTTDFTLALSDDVLARVQDAAADAGLTPEVWAAEAIAKALGPPGLCEDAALFDTARGDDLLGQQTPQALAYQHAVSVAALEAYDRTGISYPLEDVLAEVRADLETRLAAKA